MESVLKMVQGGYGERRCGAILARCLALFKWRANERSQPPLCSKMLAGLWKDVLPAHAQIQWRQAGQPEAGWMQRGGVFKLSCSEWGPLGQRVGLMPAP